MARSADQISESFERIVVAGEQVVLDDMGITLNADGSSLFRFINKTTRDVVGAITGNESGGYSNVTLAAAPPVGSANEAQLSLSANAISGGGVAIFNIYSDDKAHLDLSGIAAADQWLLLTAGLEFTDAYAIAVGTTTGTKIGTATSQKLGFWNTTPAVQPTALTAALTQITHDGPATPDYSIQSVGPAIYGFASENEMDTLLSVVKNLQVRVDQMESKFQTIGLLA